MGGRNGGRRPKPTALHELHGTKNATRHRDRKKEPRPEGALDEPPDFLSPRQMEIWHGTLANAPRGVLARIDAGIFLTWVEACDRFERAMRAQNALDAKGGDAPFIQATKSGNVIQSPYLGIMNTAAKNMRDAASQLGFTPTARPKLGIQAGEVFDLPPSRETKGQPNTPKAKESLDAFLDRMPNGPPGAQKYN